MLESAAWVITGAMMQATLVKHSAALSEFFTNITDHLESTPAHASIKVLLKVMTTY